MMKRIVQNIKTKKIDKSEHFLRRPYEKIKKSKLRASARTRAKASFQVERNELILSI